MVNIACCNFPTTLLVLDDDQYFLKAIKYALSDKYKSICTDDINYAGDILTKNREWTKLLLQEGVSQIYLHEEPTLFSVGMNVSLLKEQVHNSNRFRHIAIVIIDYDMPEKNGLEFVRSLEDSQIKIIMLTGKAQQSTVIQAFNQKEIHRYVSKGNPDYLKILLQYIDELQDEFFFDFSKFILDSMKESKHKIFENKSFINLFNKTIRENEIIEYYLLDESGSFLMLDATANNQIWLIIKSKEDMHHFYDLAHSDDISTETLKNLKECKILTHFKALEENTSAKSWYFIDAQSLDEKKEYFYTVLKNDKHFQIKRSRIKSYQEFLGKNE